MITSSTYGIRTIILLVKNKELSNTAAIMYVILHLLFVLDVVGAIMLYKKTNISHGKL